jgi:hypothetical protein
MPHLTLVWVEFQGQLPVRLLNLVGRGVLAHSQQLVELCVIGAGRSAAPHAAHGLEGDAPRHAAKSKHAAWLLTAELLCSRWILQGAAGVLVPEMRCYSGRVALVTWDLKGQSRE